MGRPRTATERKHLRVMSIKHWERCEGWGARLQVDKSVVNDHWSCCLKDVCIKHDPSKAKIDVMLRVRDAFSKCLLRRAEHSDRLATWNYRRAVQAVTQSSRVVPSPQIDKHVKVMLWAIRTVGGTDNAQTALERAVRFLEGA